MLVYIVDYHTNNNKGFSVIVADNPRHALDKFMAWASIQDWYEHTHSLNCRVYGNNGQPFKVIT